MTNSEVYNAVKRDYKLVYSDVPETLTRQRLRRSVARLKNKARPLSYLGRWGHELKEKLQKEAVKINVLEDGCTLKSVELEYPAAVELISRKLTYTTFQVCELTLLLPNYHICCFLC